MSSTTLLILNPASGRGAAGRLADRLVAQAEAICGSLDVATTSGPGDAVRLARSAVAQGLARVLVAGGDGTIGEVVTGILSAAGVEATPGHGGSGPLHGTRARPSLGLVPLGSGCDLARALGLPRRVEAALEVIAAGYERPLDAGRVEVLDLRGGRQVRYFANELSTGLSGETVKRVGRFRAHLAPRLAFLLGAVSAVASHQPFEASVEIDGERVYEGAISLFAVANGCYFGAGMRVAPEAAFDDGWLEVVIARGLGRREIFTHLPSFYLGRHGRHPKVSFHAARRVSLIPKAGDAAVEIDGESGFVPPLRVECIPAALRVYTPAATIPVTTGRVVPRATRVAAPVALRRGRA